MSHTKKINGSSCIHLKRVLIEIVKDNRSLDKQLQKEYHETRANTLLISG